APPRTRRDGALRKGQGHPAGDRARKGVLELQRILGTEGAIELAVGTNHVRAQIGEIRFTSKLIDGRFPEYARVIPTNPPRTVEADRETLRQALQRTAILSNEKYRGIRLTARPG